MAWEQEASVVPAIYECVVASGSSILPWLVESVQDGMIKEELERSKTSPNELFPPPLEQLHQRLQQLRTAGPAVPGSIPLTETSAIRACLRELFQYARVEGAHALDLVVKSALSSVKDRQLQRAADVVAPFPRLLPLIAVMGWDVLAGHTAARRQLMDLFWNSRAKGGGLPHGKPVEEVSCVEQLCDQLCYRLELACFAAHMNSTMGGQAGGVQIFRKGIRPNEEDNTGAPADPFVANLVLERLTMHSPVRVIFDVVPDINLRDALELVKMQPAGVSASASIQRNLDLELLHMNYGVQAAVHALGAMELSTADEFKTGEQQRGAAFFLEELHEHLEAISTPVRRVWMMSMIMALLHMDELSVQPVATEGSTGLAAKQTKNNGDMEAATGAGDSEKLTAVVFVGNILAMLCQCLPAVGLELEARSPASSKGGLGRKGSITGIGFPGRAGKKAWEQKAELLHQFVEDWEWRLAVLQRLSPTSLRPWEWREALAVLRAAPSTLLNLCVQRAQYDLGEEAVHRFGLPPEEAASLELAEWVDGAVARASVDDAVSRVAEGSSSTDEALNFAALRAPLAPLASVLLCLDVAMASARSVDMARHLLDRARPLLSQISQLGSREQGPEQRQEACIVLVAKRVMHRLQELLDQDKSGALQLLLSGADMVTPSGTDSIRQGPRQRALAILQQTIEDATNGKRQFLSGKLHNLVRALADEEVDDWTTSPHGERRPSHLAEHGLGLGLGFSVTSKTTSVNVPSPTNTSGLGGYFGEGTPSMVPKGTVKRFLGPLTNKPMACLSAFILYIATVGDIVDGIDTSHDYNFFALVYERPNDLLTRLVFERGSADAAGEVADIMGAVLVHQVISACVPPVYPPRGGRGWACIPQLPTRTVQPPSSQRGDVHFVATTSPNEDETELYPLQIDVVKHLATLSPVRAILACVFGQSHFSTSPRDASDADSSIPQTFGPFLYNIVLLSLSWIYDILCHISCLSTEL